MSAEWVSPTTEQPRNGLGAGLTPRQRTHLRRLTNWWTLLADLSFSDLLLFVRSDGTPDAGPAADPSDTPLRRFKLPNWRHHQRGDVTTKLAAIAGADTFRVAAQVRAATGRTLYRDDHVGLTVSGRARPYVAQAFNTGEVQAGEVRLVPNQALARVTSIPVPADGEVIAVLSREVAPDYEKRRGLGTLEKTYLAMFDRLAAMVAVGQFPYPIDDADETEAADADEPAAVEWDTGVAPRVGDGLIVVSDSGLIEFASPNAVSSLHRVGVGGDVEGRTLADAGMGPSLLGAWRSASEPVTAEIEQADVTIQVTALRLSGEPDSRAALVLLRDVSALRLRDRLLLSKDRTIAEVHHRVKNNLQTISSLLRIQARRLREPEARAALDESIRRIGAIAVVHEALAGGSSEQADVCSVAKMLTGTMADSVASARHNLEFTIRCNAPTVPSDVMTPLAVVLNELLQNAIDHGYPNLWDEEGSGHVDVAIDLAVGTGDVDQVLQLAVRDDGLGISDSFDPATDRGLGTTIIRALTHSDLGGEFTMRRRTDGRGTEAVVRVPLGTQHATSYGAAEAS